MEIVCVVLDRFSRLFFLSFFFLLLFSLSFLFLFFIFHFFTFLQLYCPNGISLMAKFGLLSLGKASCDRVALPNIRCMLGVLVFP